ncbi:DNA primase [Cardiobacterium hominis]|uniref:DNA primase n=1 Tax=Cardiobacterium hominis (strain ATCC 15826 / DSM 8339 / NCTC 10426 / 6573) TaxID=638300 RepID=C8NCL1_CARH6|nr:DNA primase [Cardiobacterium hominis]EEV87634.1 DNA primase [Cardiobacterium hominis ATCC 15826]VEG77472.1 DNA primase [Cardiobacterium hominis]
MAKRIPKPFIDELTARTDLLALLSSRITFTKKSGSNHWACCPFHDEKTPSFSVNTQKGFYHCFGCGVSGDAIRFLMDYDNLPFPEAIERLAEFNGLSVPYEDDGRQVDPQEKDRYDLGLECLADAAAFFHEAFYGESGKAARDYLRQRRLKKATVDTFLLGYAPPGNALLAHLGSKYPLQLLQDVGLVGVKDDHHYDWFRERVIFPIHNIKGKTIAFGARAMGEAQPKYLNSPETTWFNKRFELYGLHQAMQTRERTLLVTEGYMDVIKLWQHGVKNAVAALGTAIGDSHISQLRKRAEKVYFSFDGDTAGQKAARKALEAVFSQHDKQHEWRFMFMPAGEDPDSLVEKAGIAAFQQVMDASLPASAFFLQTLDDGAGAQRSAEAQAELAGEAQRWLELLPDADFREILRAQVMKRFDLPVLTLSGNAATATHTASPAWRPPREMVVVKPKDKGIQLMARLLLQPQCALPLRRWEYPPEDAELQLFWLYCYALQSSGADSAHAEAFLHQHGVYEAVASAAKLLARLDAQQQRDEFTDMLANLQKNYVSQQARLEKFSVARIKQD